MAYSFIDTLFANGDDMDPSPFWVLMALCWFVNEKKATSTTGACWPSIKKIAAKAHVSELTARKSIKVLMEKKFITAHQPPGKVRVFYVDFSRIKELAGGKDLEGVKDVSGVKDLEGDPLKMLKGRGERSLPPPLKDLEAEQGIEQGINKEENKEVMCAPSGNSSANAAVASAQAQTPYPEDFDQSLFDEAMLATQDSEQAPEALPDPDADLPPKKQRRSQQPRVPFPETLPDDWAEAAKIARPDIDPQRVFLKLRARYAPTTTKKTLATWKREFMNWIGKEFAYDNRYRSSAQKPQRTLGATDTRSLNHRNFGKWASHAV